MRENSERGLSLVIALVLAGLVLAAFAPVLENQFVKFDDTDYVTKNETVLKGLTRQGVHWAFTTTHSSNWHPLTWLSHMLDVQLFGEDPRGHHLTSVVFHGVNTVVLFLVLKAMTGALWRSALVAALFAVHPLHVESVAWVAERKDVLSTLFWLLTMGAYYRYTKKPAVGRYVSVVICFGLGLMAKPMLVTLPFVLLLLDFWPLRRWKAGRALPEGPARRALWQQWRGLTGEKLPLFAMTTASCAVTFLVQRKWGAVASMEEIPFVSRLANALVSYAAYIVKTVWPSRLAILYPFAQAGEPLWKVAGSALLLAGISLAAVREARRHPYLLVGWLWYLGTLVPVIGLVQVGFQSMADRYTYIPLIGLFISLCWGGAALSSRWLKSPAFPPLAAGAVLTFLVVAVRVQAGYWSDSITLFSRALAVTSDNWLAEYNIGTYLSEEGREEEAVLHYARAVSIRPDLLEGQYNLGLSLTRLGREKEAIEHLREAVRLRPAFLDARNLLAVSLDKQGRYEESMAQYREALRINPSSVDTMYNMASSFVRQGSHQSAEPLLRKILTADPDNPKAHQTLGVVLARLGRRSEAADHYREALRLQPDSAETYYNLANSQAEAGMTEEAAALYRKALQINGNFYDARYNLARVLVASGDTDQGVEQYRAALRINPDALDALNNLSWLFSTHRDPDVRNASDSIRLAERAAELTGYGDPVFLDTLAAAYAEAGRYDDALKTARKAAALAESSMDEKLHGDITHRMELYRSGKPYRDQQ